MGGVLPSNDNTGRCHPLGNGLGHAFYLISLKCSNNTFRPISLNLKREVVTENQPWSTKISCISPSDIYRFSNVMSGLKWCIENWIFGSKMGSEFQGLGGTAHPNMSQYPSSRSKFMLPCA